MSVELVSIKVTPKARALLAVYARRKGMFKYTALEQLLTDNCPQDNYTNEIPDTKPSGENTLSPEASSQTSDTTETTDAN